MKLLKFVFILNCLLLAPVVLLFSYSSIENKANALGEYKSKWILPELAITKWCGSIQNNNWAVLDTGSHGVTCTEVSNG